MTDTETAAPLTEAEREQLAELQARADAQAAAEAEAEREAKIAPLRPLADLLAAAVELKAEAEALALDGPADFRVFARALSDTFGHAEAALRRAGAFPPPEAAAD